MNARRAIPGLLASMVALLAVLLLSPRLVGAAEPSLVLQTESGTQGPLWLEASRGGYVGTFALENRGNAPLRVLRMGLRGEDVRDPVVGPLRLSVKMAHTEGRFIPVPGPWELESGGKAQVEVAWMPSFAEADKPFATHLVVTSNDPHQGEQAMSLRARIPSPGWPWGGHVLTVMVLLAFGAMAVGVLAHVLRQEERAWLRFVLPLLMVSELALGVALVQGFRGSWVQGTRFEGVQFVERYAFASPFGVEYFVGVDGAGLALLVSALVVASAVMVGHGPGPRFGLRMATLSGALGGALLALVAVDATLFVLGLEILVVTTAVHGLLVGTRGERQEVPRLVAHGHGAILLVAAGLVVLHRASDATFLGDGTFLRHGWAATDWARQGDAFRGPGLGGVAVHHVAFPLLGLGCLLLMGILPRVGWLDDLPHLGRGPSALVLGGLWPVVAMAGLWRFTVRVMPGGGQVASGALVALGVVVVLRKAFGLWTTDHRTMAEPDWVAIHGGVALAGIGSLTPEGLAGALAIAHAVGPTLALGRWGLGSRWLLGGGPGTLLFWATFLCWMGLMPLFPELAVLLALGWASAWALSSKERAGDGGGRTSSSFGGARAGERWARALVLVAIGGLVLLEGVVPTLFFDRIAGAVSDEVRQVNPPGPDRLARSSRAILGPWVALRP